MEQCTYCKNMFKQVAKHINKCPARLKEIADMQPCPYCNEMFKRVATHLRYCRQKPEEEDKMARGKPTKNDSSSKENDNNEIDTVKMQPCPHCNEMFKRVATHLHSCPEKPKEEGKKATEKQTKSDSSSREKDNNDIETLKTQPCPHCKKMFKRVASHIHSCPKKPEDKGKTPRAQTTKNDSSLSENEKNDLETLKTQPCPYCQKMFKRVGSHIHSCPEKPENGDMFDGKVMSNDTSSEENDSNADAHYFDETDTVYTPEINKLPDSLFNQSESKIIFTDFNSSSKTQTDEYENRTTKSAPREPIYQPIHGNYQASALRKIPASEDSWETSSELSSHATSMSLKRPPLHGSHVEYHEVQTADYSWNNQRSLTNWSENSFSNRTSELDDSFAYLQQDLKRPPIHKISESHLLSETNKKLLFPNNEEEVSDFQHHSSRE